MLTTLIFQAVAKGSTTVTVPNLTVRNAQGQVVFSGSPQVADQREVDMRMRSPQRNQRGLTLVELIVAFTIMLDAHHHGGAAGALQGARHARARIARTTCARCAQAIDKYKDYADLGYLGPQKLGTNNWPETLEILVEGVKLPGPDGKKMRFLRRIPVDPFTGKAEWGMRSDQDDPKSLSWGGQYVFDVYSKTMEKAADGKPYSEW